MRMFGLWSEKRKCLMETSFMSNGEAEFSNEVRCELSSFIGGNHPWMTTSEEHANQVVSKGSTSWYSSCMEYPEWDEERFGPLTVVCLNDFEMKE